MLPVIYCIQQVKTSGEKSNASDDQIALWAEATTMNTKNNVQRRSKEIRDRTSRPSHLVVLVRLCEDLDISFHSFAEA